MPVHEKERRVVERLVAVVIAVIEAADKKRGLLVALLRVAPSGEERWGRTAVPNSRPSSSRLRAFGSSRATSGMPIGSVVKRVFSSEAKTRSESGSAWANAPLPGNAGTALNSLRRTIFFAAWRQPGNNSARKPVARQTNGKCTANRAAVDKRVASLITVWRGGILPPRENSGRLCPRPADVPPPPPQGRAGGPGRLQLTGRPRQSCSFRVPGRLWHSP